MIDLEAQCQFEIYGERGEVWVRHIPCGTEITIDAGESLAELNQRAGEHAEVCR